MVPTSVWRLPEICPMSVVFPAPLGPMRACTSPSAISSATLSVATTPPKRFVTLFSSSIFSSRNETGNALRREEHDDEQDDADAQAGVLLVIRRDLREPGKRVIGYDVLEPEEHGRADYAAPEVTDAAEDHHDHEGPGLQPVQHVRIHVLAMAREQCAGKSARGPGHDEAQELVAVDGQAERLHPGLVLADRNHHPAEPGMDHAVQRVEGGEEEEEDDVVEDERVVQVQAETELGPPRQR